MIGRQIWEASSVETEKEGEENGTELSLDLSIGGSFKKLKNPEYAFGERDVLEGQQLRIRVRDREAREKETNITEEWEDLNLALSYNPTRNQSFRPSCQQNQNSVSDDPSLCISSDDSDNRSCCHQGGCSSDNWSYSSSELKLELPELRDTIGHCPTEGAVPPSVIRPLPSGPSLHEDNMTRFDPAYRPTMSQRTDHGRSEISSAQELGKLPKPKSDKPFPFSHMPCVSTTGDGPNGRTVTGFLYKYTKAEVKIVCVCHGSSFTPAEFVEHAGGRDFVSHPLRRITVVASVFQRDSRVCF